MNSDLTFITNEKERTLLERFKVLIKDASLFDVLVGYFYTSGFYALYKSLESTEKIRILIGMGTGKETIRLIQKAKGEEQLTLQFSHAVVKQEFGNSVTEEMEQSEDSANVEEGVFKFIEWLKNGKLKIRAYPSRDIHAKLYIMTFTEGDRDTGRVITGSSNFTRAGLIDNLEFNVELKNRSDYEFALEKFNELWENSVDISDKYVETINSRTWLNNTITPYELYLKYLYEYLREKINIDQEKVIGRYRPRDFMDLEYQREAVQDTKSKLKEYGGVFLSDVVGLGKTYISAMLAQELSGRNLIICPPVLKEYWQDTFTGFNLQATVESLGKLDQLAKKGTEDYENIFIDEAHRFRNESNQTYEKLKEICWGKKIILVSATPQNNTPIDLLSQIKLFQKGHKSTIPGLQDIERYFNSLQKKLKGIDRQSDFAKYISIIKENSKAIRENVLKDLMVRRTRGDVEKYFSQDLKNEKLKFPTIRDPEKVYYEFDEETDRTFNKTIEKIKGFQYFRYTPILYLKNPKPEEKEELVGQRNLRRFMKILLVKRLESSFFAFKKTLNRFISSYERFIKMFEGGTVYISKKYTHRIFELLNNDDEDEIMRLVEEEKIRQYKIDEFKDGYVDNLRRDLRVLREIESLWKNITADPKIEKFKEILESDKILKGKKIIVFTESRETAEYLEQNLKSTYKDAVMSYSSQSSARIQDKVIENYDPKCKYPKDDISLLISTEILSEGVNLHRSNVVVNYDLPWNPTRVIQRVGRINRVDTTFNDIYIYNFFPTKQSNDVMKLEEAAIGKLQSFHDMLGEDAAYLTDGEEVGSHELFNRVNSKRVIGGEDEELGDSELEYLMEIRAVRDKNPDLFEKIKYLPKKARSAKKYPVEEDAVLTFFRKGSLRKVFITDSKSTRELDFFLTANILKSVPEEKREKPGKKFYGYLDNNKEEFRLATLEEIIEPKQKGGRSSEAKLKGIIKAIQKTKGFTEDDDKYLKKVLNLLEEGILPKQTSKTIMKNIGKEMNPLKILSIIRKHTPDSLFAVPVTDRTSHTSGPREVILSEYLIGE
ncbi:helicase [candidate division WOR-3 bacterium JGI_Cruoil_03_44_89]|uniref:Helicase n=1 Tax=candidate division WOR-3 bacterium JGI_Cruoil_03_44_89 TaxID=1973748 RepID=A0A235BZ02_UNCW3|nr:MAG: helicase [candidate division WOR-3 bacterium JGI_Cruoil_03_44_89]